MPKADTRLSDRQGFAASVYVSRAGLQRNALSRELGAGSTAHDRFQERLRTGVFAAV